MNRSIKMERIHLQTCRTCLRYDRDNLFALERQIENSPSGKTYKEILEDIAQIVFQDEKDIHMPQSVCRTCWNQLNSTHDFILQAKKCNDDLKEMLNVFDCLEEKAIDISSSENCSNNILVAVEDKSNFLSGSSEQFEEPAEENMCVANMDIDEDHEINENLSDYEDDHSENIETLKRFYSNRDFFGTQDYKINCYFCQHSSAKKQDLLRHIKGLHKAEIVELLRNSCPTDNREDDIDEVEFVCNLIHSVGVDIKTEIRSPKKKLQEYHADDTASKHANSNSKVNKCKFCKNAYSRKQDLMKHIRSEHADNEKDMKNTNSNENRKSMSDDESLHDYEDIEYLDDKFLDIFEEMNVPGPESLAYEEIKIEKEYEEVKAPCSESSGNESSSAKKRKPRNPELWQSNIRKQRRESGKQYISIKKKVVPARKVTAPSSKSQCKNCLFACAKIFTAQDRLEVFKSFWSLTDNEKTSFYLEHVRQQPVKRRRSKSETKQFTFEYYFEKNQKLLRVCRVFFMSTLNISQKRIYYCFQKLKTEDGTPIERRNGKNVKRVTPPEKLAEIREHISSFPTWDCPAGSNRKYLDSTFNLVKMYEMYTTEYANPISINMYRQVFKKEFNISFEKPKNSLY